MNRSGNVTQAGNEEKAMFKTYLISGYKGADFQSEIFTGYSEDDAEMKAFNSGYTAITRIKEM